MNTRPVTNDEIAYRDGYVRGKSAEQLEHERRRAAEARVYEDNARLRADNGVSTGLVLGLVLAAVAAVVGGIAYVYSDAGNEPTITTPAPTSTTPQPANNQRTIIQRTIERTREVVPVPTPAQPPEINVELNNPVQPAPNPAPVNPAPANPAPTNQAPVSPAPAEPAQPQANPNQVPNQNPQSP
ncbi:MAG TPA: hypothetical protein VEZ50_18555 [Nodosilinea sp.]|nr:hypothetical protein [Nodosilinea sp.]